MTTYNWDLIERLLHEVQNGEGSFAPRKYAEQEAAEKATAGESTGNLDALKKTAADYEALLFKRGFIESRPEEEGGNGENFILTPRGASLLSLLDSSIPGSEHPRQVMDEQDDALDPATFDEVASKAAIAGEADIRCFS
ncbi:transcriptional regulator [Pseudomonas sp. S1_E04]